MRVVVEPRLGIAFNQQPLVWLLDYHIDTTTWRFRECTLEYITSALEDFETSAIAIERLRDHAATDEFKIALQQLLRIYDTWLCRFRDQKAIQGKPLYEYRRQIKEFQHRFELPVHTPQDVDQNLHFASFLARHPHEIAVSALKQHEDSPNFQSHLNEAVLKQWKSKGLTTVPTTIAIDVTHKIIAPNAAGNRGMDPKDDMRLIEQFTRDCRVQDSTRDELSQARKVISDRVDQLKMIEKRKDPSKTFDEALILKSCQVEVGRMGKLHIRALSSDTWDSVRSKNLTHTPQCLTCQCFYYVRLKHKNPTKITTWVGAEGWSSYRAWQCAEAILASYRREGHSTKLIDFCLWRTFKGGN